MFKDEKVRRRALLQLTYQYYRCGSAKDKSVSVNFKLTAMLGFDFVMYTTDG